MARSRRGLDRSATVGSGDGGNGSTDNNEGENGMSATETAPVFTETLSAEEWKSEGGAGSAARGMYAQVLIYVRDSGKRYHRIPMDRGPFAGKKAASVGTALKNTQNGKNAPEGVGPDVIKITSKGANDEKGTKGVVFIENTAVDDEA